MKKRREYTEPTQQLVKLPFSKVLLEGSPNAVLQGYEYESSGSSGWTD